MENAHKTMAKLLSGGLWPSVIIMAASGLEFSWLDHVLGDELVAAILTLVTPLPFASLASRASNRRTQVQCARKDEASAHVMMTRMRLWWKGRRSSEPRRQADVREAPRRAR